MTCNLAKKGFNKYSLFLPSPNMMSQRRCFVSEFGGVLFPSLAVFCFRVWRCFVSEFGGVLFPSLAVFEMVEFLGELCW
jgi:hypothetical protein